MEKVRLFLIYDGIIIVVVFLFFFWLYFKKRTESRFRDDHWRNVKPPGQGATTEERLKWEETIDQRILLGHQQSQRTEEKSSTASSPTAPYRFPRFRGKPHEVLGIAESSSAETISAAHRHWIKRYHPDRVNHLGAQYVEQARRRSEQLNAARDFMLQRWKKGK